MSSRRHADMMTDALLAGERRNYQRSAEILTTLISETDEFPAAYLYLGRSYHALGKLERAIQYLRYFVEIEPRVGAGYFFLGRSYVAAEIYAEAVACLITAESLDPENPQVLGLLGYTYLKRRQTELAVDVLSRAVELSPDNGEIFTAYLNALVVEAIRRFRRGDTDLARQMLEFLVARGVSESLTRLYLAYTYRRLGRDADALEQYDWILERNPNDSILLLHRADTLFRMGNVDHARSAMSSFGADEDETPDAPTLNRLLAIEAYEQNSLRRSIEYARGVIKQIGSDFEMHLLIGEAYRRLSIFGKAENHFRRAVHLRKKRIEPRHGLILVNWQQGRFDEVQACCKAALIIDASDETARYYSVLSRGGMGRTDDTLIADLEAEVERNGPDAYLFTCLADQHARLEHRESASRYYRMAIDVSESHLAAYEGLLAITDERSDPEAAAELYHAYFARFPVDVTRRKKYIQVLVTLSDYERAIEQIQLQLPYEGENEGLRRLQAFCLREVSKFREAGIVYRRLLKERPDSDIYLRSLAFCLERSGNREQAISLMERAFEYKSPSASLRLIFGALLFRADRMDEALKEFRLVLDSRSNDWRVYANIAAIYRERGNRDMYERFSGRAEELRRKA